MKSHIITFFYFLSASFGSFCSYFNLEPLVIYILIFTFFLDTILGVVSAKKQKTYVSRKGKIMVFTKIVGFTLIFITGVCLKLINLPYESFILSSLMVLAFHDIISILRHVYYLRTEEKLPEFDAVSKLIRSLHTKLIKIINSILNPDNYDKKSNE